MKSLNSILACLLLSTALPAAAAEFVVTRFDDPLPQACTAQSCSLREAVLAGNIDEFAPPDRIILPAGNYTLIRGELVLGHDVDVVGAGAATTSIASDANVFTAPPSGLALSVRGVRIETTDFHAVAMIGTGSVRLEGVDVPADGGRISVSGDATLEIQGGVIADVVMCNNTAGACTLRDTHVFSLYLNPAEGEGATLVLDGAHIDDTLFPDAPLDSTVTVHQSPSITILDSTFTDTALRLTDATVQGNDSLFDGSSIYLTDTTFRLEDSTMTGGSMRIENAGIHRATLRRFTYFENTGPVRSESPSRVLIEDSEFNDNPVRALYAANASDWTVRRSTFARNAADGSAGGAIVIEDSARMTIENSTFSANTFPASAAQEGARGAAIGFRNIIDARLDLEHVTMVEPGAMPVGVLGNLVGGIAEGEMVVNIHNSLLRGDCWLQPGVLHFGSGSIEGPGDTCDLPAGGGNRVGVGNADVDLGPLGDHGGPTPTYEPGPGSIARDTAEPAQCLAEDQRGFPRPAGAGCDVGAVEIGASIDLFDDGFEDE